MRSPLAHGLHGKKAAPLRSGLLPNQHQVNLPRVSATGMSTTAMEARQRVLSTGTVRGLNNRSVRIMGFIALEMVERLSAASRQRPVVPMVRVETVVHMADKPARPMEPRPGSNEDAAGKPVRPIVPIRRAIVRRIVKVSIRTHRRNANAYRDLRSGRMAR